MCDVIRSLWIFCPQMPPRDVPKMSQIGVKHERKISWIFEPWLLQQLLREIYLLHLFVTFSSNFWLCTTAEHLKRINFYININISIWSQLSTKGERTTFIEIPWYRLIASKNWALRLIKPIKVSFFWNMLDSRSKNKNFRVISARPDRKNGLNKITGSLW